VISTVTGSIQPLLFEQISLRRADSVDNSVCKSKLAKAPDPRQIRALSGRNTVMQKYYKTFIDLHLEDRSTALIDGGDPPTRGLCA
jgi:hypothetical protein